MELKFFVFTWRTASTKGSSICISCMSFGMKTSRKWLRKAGRGRQTPSIYTTRPLLSSLWKTISAAVIKPPLATQRTSWMSLIVLTKPLAERWTTTTGSIPIWKGIIRTAHLRQRIALGAIIFCFEIFLKKPIKHHFSDYFNEKSNYL